MVRGQKRKTICTLPNNMNSEIDFKKNRFFFGRCKKNGIYGHLKKR